MMETEFNFVSPSVEPAASRRNPTYTTAQEEADNTSAARAKASRTKRAKVACRHCRRRKVRCDVDPHGAPCTNCRLDQIKDCAPCGKKPRRSGSWEVEDRVRLLKPSEALPKSPSPCAEMSVSALTPEDGSTLLSDEPAISDDGPTTNPSARAKGPSPSPDQLPRPRPALKAIVFNTPPGLSLPLPPQLWSAPRFLTCDLSHILSDDIAYLQSKHCFAFPDKDVVDELLQCYFDYIAPHMPFIDETSFWDMYHTLYFDSSQETAGQTRISLLLFHAMLFAGTTCAPMSLLRRLGHTSRSTARRVAFFRVRALYSLDIEKDNLVLIQAFLLMSYWRGDSSEDKDAGHWIGLAVSLAQHLGLHRQASTQLKLTQRQDAVRRRCWWSCVVRDRLIALSQYQRPRIRLEEPDTPMLTLADYNVGLRSGMGGLSPAEELGKRTALSILSLQLIRLLLCVDANAASSARSCVSSPASFETWAKTPRSAHNGQSVDGHSALDEWRVNLPEILQRSGCVDADESVLPCILVHRDALQIYYHQVILLAATPCLLSAQEPEATWLRTLPLARSSLAAIGELYEDLVDRDLLHYLPSMSSCTTAWSLLLVRAQTSPHISPVDFFGGAAHLSKPWQVYPGGNATLQDGSGELFEDVPGFVDGDDTEDTTDGPNTGTSDGSSPGSGFKISFDDFLPMDSMVVDKSLTVDKAASGLLGKDPLRDDKDPMLFTWT